jgi:predicted DCC family thiol-disulfide oxidoreductase YuxK
MDDAMRLYVLYDAGCGLCSHLVQWMAQQPSSYDLRFVAAGSEEARRLFPEFHSPARPEELVVISGEGAVYRGDAAFIVCLYALHSYRALAVRLAQPGFRPLARRVFGMLSTNRVRLSELLGLHSDDALARTINREIPHGEALW